MQSRAWAHTEKHTGVRAALVCAKRWPVFRLHPLQLNMYTFPAKRKHVGCCWLCGSCPARNILVPVCIPLCLSGGDDALACFLGVWPHLSAMPLCLPARSPILFFVAGTLSLCTLSIGAGFCVSTFSAALQHLGRQAEDRAPKGAFSSFLGRRSQFF